VVKMCKVFEVSTSGYYKWRNKEKSKMQERKEEVEAHIFRIYHEFKQVYGSPRIFNELLKIGEVVSLKTVARYMKEMGLNAVSPLHYTITTDSTHTQWIYPNLLQRKFKAEHPNQIWVADITYIWTSEGWIYLASVMDLFSRKIIGWNIGTRLTKELAIVALERALTFRTPSEGMIHHSDRGSQYASNEYTELLQRNKIEISMSRKGDCYDNACIESFHSSLKKELVYRVKFKKRTEAKSRVWNYISGFYNAKRSHSTLNYVSPNQFEKQYEETQRKNALLSPATFGDEQLSL
jgi:putative transposase